MLMYEYGLEGAFLELDDSRVVPEPVSLIIKFKETVLDNLHITVSDFHSLNDRLLSSRYVTEVWPYQDWVFYKIPLADDVKPDIRHIIDSNYQKVSPLYRKNIVTPVRTLPKWPDNMGHFLLKYNIPLAVLKKHRMLREMTEEELGVHGVTGDLVRRFNLGLDVYIP